MLFRSESGQGQPRVAEAPAATGAGSPSGTRPVAMGEKAAAQPMGSAAEHGALQQLRSGAVAVAASWLAASARAAAQSSWRVARPGGASSKRELSLLPGGAGNQPIPNFVRSSMKKFKSLMLAALASAALAAPSFADGHSLSMSGEIILGMKYTTKSQRQYLTALSLMSPKRIKLPQI